MRRMVMFTVVALALTAGSAMAESIGGRMGITGKVGGIVPLKDISVAGDVAREHDAGLAAGGGLIFGLGRCFALELDVLHAPSVDVKKGGVKEAEQQTTDLSLGLQYRIMPDHRFVPYIGAGADFITGDIAGSSIDWTYGGHGNIGFDYFVNRSIALTADFRGIFGAKSDIVLNGNKVGRYDPLSFVGTLGVRLFLPEKLY